MRMNKKFLWAIDPYGDVKTQSLVATLVKTLSEKITIEPVYVHGQSGFPFEANEKSVRFNLAEIEQTFKETIKALEFKSDQAPTILAHDSAYLRAAVKTLVSYAKKVNAAAILVSTHARTGIMRYVLGSFVETLILESSVPIMIVNPKTKIEARPGIILYPTDFSDLSWTAFQEVASFAKLIDAQIRIFHQYQGEAQSIPEDVNYFHNNHWLSGEHLLDKELQEVKIKLKKWLSWCEQHNIACDHSIKFGLKNIADATLAEAKKEKVWMIAMATATGRVAAAFPGSNARWVTRAALCPVWILHVPTEGRA